MKIVQQNVSLNIDDILPEVKTPMHKHSSLLPKSIRCLVSGPSGSGKTYATLGLLYHPQGVRFENVYVYSKSLYQPKYETLREVMAMVPECGYYEFSDNEDLVKPEDVKEHSIIILDDIACSKHDKIMEFFSMGRHRNVDCFYLCQTYSKIPKQLIRDNANMCIVFPQDKLNLKHIYDNNIFDITFDKFTDICRYAWSGDRHSFLTICHDFETNEGRYRQNFDRYIIP